MDVKFLNKIYKLNYKLLIESKHGNQHLIIQSSIFTSFGLQNLV